jgi:periplasmic protein TonB
MESNSKFIVRFLAASALLHAAVGLLVIAMVRVGGANPSASSSVEVTLVAFEPEAPPPPSLQPLEPAAIDAAPATDAGPALDAPPATDPAPALDSAPPETEYQVDLAMAMPTIEPRYGSGDGAESGQSATLGATATTTGTSTGAPDAGAGHDATVRAWLEKHKRYPRAAEQRRIEGEATLELVLDASGDVRESRIVRSSGHRILDDEVTRMVERSKPFPTNTHTGVASYRIVVVFLLEEQ